jgi:hypothetical protein
MANPTFAWWVGKPVTGEMMFQFEYECSLPKKQEEPMLQVKFKGGLLCYSEETILFIQIFR